MAPLLAHASSIPELFKKLKSREGGLTSPEAKERFVAYGPNQLAGQSQAISRARIWLEQWKSPLLLILLVAGIVSGLLGETLDMAVIIGTAVINAMVGYFQENKANQSLARLRTMVQHTARVRRDDTVLHIPSSDIVAGDIVMVVAGDRVPADGRIIESKDFLVNEAPFTGESEPVKKKMGDMHKDAAVADQRNMVFCGTTVTNGRATILITHTGANTQLGAIAALVAGPGEEKTPLQRQLARMSSQLAWIILSLAALIFIVGTIIFPVAEYGTFGMFQLAVAIAVAAIPEGLVISLTITLAVAMQQILRRHALVRKLLAAETLGSVNVICTDKTGTITKGEMMVTRIITAADDVVYEEIAVLHKDHPDHRRDALMALHIGIVCNEAALAILPDGKEIIVGDTTDIAFVVAAQHAGYDKKSLESVYQHIDEIAFDSQNKYMARYDRIDHAYFLSVKGAPEVMFDRSTHLEVNGRQKKLSAQDKKRFADTCVELTNQGLRVIAVGYRDTKKQLEHIDDAEIKDLVLVGLVALSDPLRPDVKDTIGVASRAGIRTIMLTGDHRKTAEHIAAQAGIPVSPETVIDGTTLHAVSDAELEILLANATVFARLDPAQKIRIVQALQRQEYVVAMTGDGVNDAPALRAADIGIALGSGTDVAKETSDIILLDDSLGTIVTAIEEGRAIYQNIKKVILYLLANSFTEVVIIIGSLMSGLPMAVLPVQILWVNIIQDAIPTIALAFDKGDPANMRERPRPRRAPLIDREMWVMIILKSILSNIALFALFYYIFTSTSNIALARTIVLVGLAIDALFYIFSIRSLHRMVWRINVLKNPYILASVAFGWLMLGAAVYLPQLQYLLRTVPLSLTHWYMLIAYGVCNLALFELIKCGFILFKKRNYATV